MSGERLRRRELLPVSVMGCALACAAFQWGGVVRTGRYEYLLAIGILGVAWTAGGSAKEWAPAPGRAMRWGLSLLPAYVLLQTVPMPVEALRLISPARAAGVAALVRAGAGMRFASLSVFPAGTFQYFLLVCAYVLLFLLAREMTFHFRNRVWVMAWPLLGVAALEAGLGLWQFFAAGGTGEQERWGTYANHNHFAGFLEMSLPFAVMYAVARVRRPRDRMRSSGGSVLAAIGSLTVAGVVFAGIVYSFSRMGFLATLFSLFVMGVLVLATPKFNSVARSRWRSLTAAGGVAALIVASFAFLPPDKLIGRFAKFVSADGLTDEGRSGLWIETLPLIKAYPLFGCGLGGYETAFSKFKVSGMLVTDDFAHNDYLQLLAELGLAGFVMGAALAFAVVKTAWRAAARPASPDAGYFAIACLGALAAIALHSMADFNLYIPANAMLLAWVGGAAAASGLRPTERRAPDRLAVENSRTEDEVEVGSRDGIYV